MMGCGATRMGSDHSVKLDRLMLLMGGSRYIYLQQEDVPRSQETSFKYFDHTCFIRARS
jgi:hypothetical protein